MFWVEVAIWKFGVKIRSFLFLYFVSGGVATIKCSFSFNFRQKKYKSSKSCSLLGSFVEGQKFNPLFRSDISDSLSLVEEILQIVSVVFILFLTAFDVILMLLFRFFFCKSAPLVLKRFESLILFVRFCVVFYFNLAERRGFFHGEDVSLYVTTFSVFLFS